MNETRATGGSYWIETAPGGTPLPPLGQDTEADVVVIGAGIAGLSTARELARAGRGVVVLEAGRIAQGVTGHTTAKLSALHSLSYARLLRTRDAEAAQLYARSQSDALEHAAAVVNDLGIDCDWERVPAYTYLRDTSRTGELRAEAEAARAAGLPAEYVQETGLPYPVAGAVRLADQVQFHPRKYLLALVDDLLAHGGRIYEHTTVVGLDEGEPCRVTTDTGVTVTARDVVVATHYPIFDRALLFTRLSTHRELVVAAPIAADRDPGGMYITPELNTRSVRTAPYEDGQRLLIVTGESFTPGAADTPARFEQLAEWARQHFPGITITHRWAAQDTDPTDQVPMVGRLHPRASHAYVATGFGGWGMSGGIMASRLLTSQITGDPLPWSGLYDPTRVLSAVRQAPAFLQHQARVARHFVGDRLRPPQVQDVSDIEPGNGAVVRVNGERCAVYRDDQGEAHAVSARCTHMGCLVAFNGAERTWECPCHGSRFDTDGKVIQGPATRPLGQRKV